MAENEFGSFKLGQPDASDPYYQPFFYQVNGELYIAVTDKQDNMKYYKFKSDGNIYCGDDRVLTENNIMIDEIKLYAGDTNNLELGWYVCNGQNGTVDLSNKSIDANGTQVVYIQYKGYAESENNN